MIWLTHPFGNANVRAVLEALKEKKSLDFFWTTIGLSTTGFTASNGLLREIKSLKRRVFSIEKSQIRSHPYREMVRHVSQKIGIPSLIEHEVGWASVDQVWRSLDRFVAKNLNKSKVSPSLVYHYEDGACETFRVAKSKGIRCLYDLPIGYWKKAEQVIEHERVSNPEFIGMMDGGRDSLEKKERKEEEISLADRIIACSPFVRESLVEWGIPAAKIFQVQFGSPTTSESKRPQSVDLKRKIRLLFVGRIDQRKGIGYLWRALKNNDWAKSYSLHMIGVLPQNQEPMRPYRDLFTHQGSCSKEEIFKQMREADLLVLPTLFEGQALVILEAMASGIPVLTTTASGASEVIREGIDGWIIPSHSEEALAEKLEMIISHREQLSEMGISAAHRAQSFRWKDYGKEIVAICNGMNQ